MCYTIQSLLPVEYFLLLLRFPPFSRFIYQCRADTLTASPNRFDAKAHLSGALIFTAHSALIKAE